MIQFSDLYSIIGNALAGAIVIGLFSGFLFAAAACVFAAAACVGSIALSFVILLTNALAYGLRRLMRSI